MIRRFRLEQKGLHEKLVITTRLCEMLDCFIEGRTTPVEMGCEQGDIPEWDDFIVSHPTGLFEHIQIKKQSTDFCTKNSTRPTTNNDLSVVDKAFRSLAHWTRQADAATLNTRQFVFSVPGLGLHLKRELTLSHLEELCTLCKQHGINIDALENRNDGPTTRIFQWLTTWCGFDNWTHIRKALQLVTIRLNGSDDDLKARALVALDRHFADPQRVHELILSYLTTQTSDTSAITCRATLHHLRDMLRPESVTWTQYYLGTISGPWQISGTHDLEGPDQESAQQVVNKMWGSNGSHRLLRVAADYNQPSQAIVSLPTAIMRLALHLQGANQSLMSSQDVWRTNAEHEIGHTLGVAENDLEHLPWRNSFTPLDQGSHRKLIGLQAHRQEALSLAEAMDCSVWEQVVTKLTTRLSNIACNDLLTEMDAMWATWKAQLDATPSLRSTLFSQLLYPQSEGKNPLHALRVGPRTVELLVTALETILVVAVAVGGAHSDWKQFTNCGEVMTIALRHWSGPAGSSSYVRNIDSDELSDLLGSSPSPVVILSGVESPSSVFIDVGMADDAATSTSLGASRQPSLLVTHARITAYLRRGTLADVRDYFGSQWNRQTEARQQAISGLDFGANNAN